ncbi:hypothetical protein [Streptosporangium roseum]|uniref:DUF4352 domain-containing protein n=1 Tax=Streptosporangium roseum (strain ATCC 12428 / DSM 43021 / JCM 3005 / KCTC 9067 / NCIMB 10171 / NRRL 2505 / NI 9100) TaxID=479432 RepID=D2AQB2_STRRD|nr:hypothetical protein [Streptosporangium roseum]ACZ84456.1 hypothetical protein Sros_1462 [Streptosporangium roseum DSM 43021]
MRRKIALAVAVPGLVVTLTACGVLNGQQLGGGGQERQSGQAAQTAASGAPAEKEQAPPEKQAPPDPAASAPSQQGEVIATRDVKAGGADLKVDVTGLRRQGRLVTLSWTVTNTGDTKWNMGSNMGDTAAYLGLTVAGVSLVDPANAKRYRVARTGEKGTAKCVCSEYDVSTEPGEVLPLYATYAAPPPDVQKINVEFPILGVFTDVPIS